MAASSIVKCPRPERVNFADIYGLKNRQIPSVSSALADYAAGRQHGYNTILQALSSKDISSETLLKLLQGLRNCASLLDKGHENLVGILLKVDWLEKEDEVIKEYQSLILDVISAHPLYLPRILRKLISKFLPATSDCPDKEDVDEATRKKHETQFGHIHQLLLRVAKCVPLTATCIEDQKLLWSAYPVTLRLPPLVGTYLQACYIRNLLQLLQYLPSLRLTTLELIVSNLLSLDVSASRKEITEALDKSDEEDNDDMFEMETEGDAREEKKAPCEGTGHPKADCLDQLMEIMFTYIQDNCHKNGKLQLEEARQLYLDLLKVFRRLILRTHNSCHVQFLLFYMCSFSCNGQLRFCTHFVDELWNLIQRADAELQTRRAAAAYLGSFLARAAFVPIQTAKTCLELMAEWVHKYIDQTSGEAIYANIERFGPFYAVCQAILYVLCFRSTEFNLNREKERQWARSLGIQKLAGSKLNPLRYVSSLVAKAFTSLARQHEVAYLDNIMQWNQRHYLPSETPGDNLMSFFPFDPYLLRRSERFIKPLQREYMGNFLSDSESESEMEEDDFLPDMPEDTASALVPGALSRTPDFLHYGTSPGFKHT